MSEYSKLIITATTANSWIYPGIKNWAQTIDELIEDVVQCYEAGAAIAHVHLPRYSQNGRLAVWRPARAYSGEDSSTSLGIKSTTSVNCWIERPM